MDAGEAETAYRTAKTEYNAQKITLDEFNRRVAELKYEDNAGTWWAISPADGSWLRWDGAAWVPAFAEPASQPAVQPPRAGVTQPAARPSFPVPPAGATGAPPADQPATAAPKPPRNWAGIASLALAVLSWIAYPIVLGLAALLAGISGLYLSRKQGSRVPVTAVIGIIAGFLAIAANIFWLDLFPPPSVMPSLY